MFRRAMNRWRDSWLRSKICPWRFGVDSRVGELQFWFRNLQNTTIEKFGEMVQENETRADADLNRFLRKIETAAFALERKIQFKADEDTVKGVVRVVEELTRRINILEGDKKSPFSDCPKMTESERQMHRTPEDDVCYQGFVESDFRPGTYEITWQNSVVASPSTKIAIVTIECETGRKLIQCASWRRQRRLSDILPHIAAYKALEVAESPEP